MNPDVLKEFRVGFGFTQAQFAERIGMSLRTYQSIESGQKRMSLLHENAIRYVVPIIEMAAKVSRIRQQQEANGVSPLPR